MEDVLDVYHLPYDPDYPVICMDESCKQMIGEVRNPIPCKSGHPVRIDDEYVRHGVAEIFMEVEPLAGKRHVAITEHRTKKEWALQIKQMLDERYKNAIQVRLVMDNLNTHNISSLYEAFEPAEARRLAKRLDIHYTPKHGSWLNMAEIELSVLKGQCLSGRIPDMPTMQTQVSAWEKERNSCMKKISWQFKTSDARIKLKKNKKQVTIDKLEKIAVSSSLKIGLFQVLGIFPGISRSAVTLFAALNSNISAQSAFQFSFLLSIPAIIGSAIFDLLQSNGKSLTLIDWNITLPAMLVAFISGLISLKLVQKLLNHNRFLFFALYCLILGLSLIFFT